MGKENSPTQEERHAGFLKSLGEIRESEDKRQRAERSAMKGWTPGFTPVKEAAEEGAEGTPRGGWRPRRVRENAKDDDEELLPRPTRALAEEIARLQKEAREERRLNTGMLDQIVAGLSARPGGYRPPTGSATLTRSQSRSLGRVFEEWERRRIGLKTASRGDPPCVRIGTNNLHPQHLWHWRRPIASAPVVNPISCPLEGGRAGR